MQMRKFAVLSALVAAATGVAASTANAAPGDLNVGLAPGLTYTGSYDAKGATLNLVDHGSFGVDNGVFKIKDDKGALLKAGELSFRVDDFVFPIKADISGRSARLTPQLDLAHATYKPVALPYEDSAPWKTPYERETAAFNRLKDTISIGATIGAAVGAISGAVVGCVIGGIAGAAAGGTVAAIITAFLAAIGLPAGAVAGAIAGCVAGAAALGIVGTLAGIVLVTGPVAIAAAIQYFTTINAPFKAAPSAPSAAPAPAKPAPKK